MEVITPIYQLTVSPTLGEKKKASKKHTASMLSLKDSY